MDADLQVQQPLPGYETLREIGRENLHAREQREAARTQELIQSRSLSSRYREQVYRDQVLKQTPSDEQFLGTEWDGIDAGDARKSFGMMVARDGVVPTKPCEIN